MLIIDHDVGTSPYPKLQFSYGEVYLHTVFLGAPSYLCRLTVPTSYVSDLKS